MKSLSATNIVSLEYERKHQCETVAKSPGEFGLTGCHNYLGQSKLLCFVFTTVLTAVYRKGNRLYTNLLLVDIKISKNTSHFNIKIATHIKIKFRAWYVPQLLITFLVHAKI